MAAISNTFVDGDSTSGVHAPHHNALATAINKYTGGSTGQVATKASAADHDIVWSTPSAGGGGSASFVSSAKWGMD